jgi:hypothetical protein
MANVRKRISELTELTSASLNTTLVGVDGGTTYKIELDTLADAVTARVNILDRDRLLSLESVTSSFETKGRSVVSSSAQITALGFISSSTIIPIGTISSSTQISDFGFVSTSVDISVLNSFTQSFSSSQNILNTAFINGISARLQTSSFNSYTASQSTSSLVDRLNTIESVSGSWITESETGSFLTSLSGAISSSSQLTSSYDTRYTLSGSVQPLPSNLVSSSAQITAFGFISSSTTINTSSFATTGSNSFNGNQNITGSLVVSAVAVVAGALTIPSASVISLTSGSSISVDASGAITGSLTGSVFGIGDVVSFSASLNSRITSLESFSGSYATTGSNTFRGQQIISSSLIVTNEIKGVGNIFLQPDVNDARYFQIYNTAAPSGNDIHFKGNADFNYFGDDTNYLKIDDSAQTVSIVGVNGVYVQGIDGTVSAFSQSVDTRLDTLEASIISGSPNYTQVLGNKRTGINSVGISIISGSITTTGNPVQIMVTGDANPTTTAWVRLQIFRDGNGIGNIIQVENSSNLNVPYCLNVIDTPSAGTYTYSMRTVDVMSGTFDFGEHTGPLLTAVELNSKTSFPSGTISGSSQLTSSFDTRYLNTGGDGVISGSSQLTSSFDTRYAISASFVSSSNLSSIQTITSASYAALTPVSGTLYIIIG